MNNLCDNKSDESISKINQYIFMGPTKHYMNNSEEFEKLGVDVVMVCEKNNETINKTNYNVIRFPIMENDGVSFLEYIDKAADAIKKNIYENKKIYLCSSKCLSRAPAVLIYYLMMYQHLSYDNAYELLKNIRPSISIDMELEDSLKIMDN